MSTVAPPSTRPSDLSLTEVAWLSAAVLVVSLGYGALLPLLPGWLASAIPGLGTQEVARHTGFLSGAYAGGVFVGAWLWGALADRAGRGRVLILGLVGYVVSLSLLLVPAFGGLPVVYALRSATGIFVAAVVPVVSTLVAAGTPEPLRARRFAWLGAMSLLGFLLGPGLDAILGAVGSRFVGPLSPAERAAVVVGVSALLGGVVMLGLSRALPLGREPASVRPGVGGPARPIAMLWMNVVVMFVLAGFEVGIVLAGQGHPDAVGHGATMVAECSLVMLGVNALLFLTALLKKVPARTLVAGGLFLAIAGLAILAGQTSALWMYLGVSFTSAGTGLVLPAVAYVAAGTSPRDLGRTMGGLAAATAFGQATGSAAGGWLFGSLAQWSFAVLLLPLLGLLALLLARPSWWIGGPGPVGSTRTPVRAPSLLETP